MRRLVAFAFGVLAVCWSADRPPAAASQAVTDLMPLLEAYDSGDYDRVDRELARAWRSVTDARQFGRVAAGSVERWVRSASRDAAPRRSLIAATTILELVHARIGDAGIAEWDKFRDLAEYACDLLRREPQHRAERWWHYALITVVESVGDYFFLPVRKPRQDPKYWNPEHIGHARDRLRDDPLLDLAEAVNAEQRTWNSSDDVRRPVLMDRGAVLAKLERGWFWGRTLGTVPSHVRIDEDLVEKLWANEQPPFGALAHNRELWLLVRRWRSLVDRPEVAVEARLRLGHTYLRLARPDLAYQEFESVVRPDTRRYANYLALLRGGMILESAGKRDDAERAFRAALSSAPRARGASMRLATLLFLDGRSDEAVEVLRNALVEPHAHDPFLFYRRGDPGRWREAIDRIRVELR